MTCIVGLVHQGKVYIGADSMSGSGYDQKTCHYPKVFRNGGFLIGYTTSFRMGQILQYHLVVEPQPEDMDDYCYMIRFFVESVREVLKTKGFSSINSNNESGGNFLVGYRGNLYEICDEFQILRYSENVAACGCAYAYALAALKSLEDYCPDPVERVRRALEISEYFSMGVKSPFHIEVLE